MNVVLLVLAWIWGALIGLIKIILWIVGAILFAVWWQQSTILYLPNIRKRKEDSIDTSANEIGYRSPNEHPYNLPFEEHFITTRDGFPLLNQFDAFFPLCLLY